MTRSVQNKVKKKTKRNGSNAIKKKPRASSQKTDTARVSRVKKKAETVKKLTKPKKQRAIGAKPQVKRQKFRKRILITGGPTRAYIDDVRYISNHSTGDIAFAMAERFVKKGWQVMVVSGPTQQNWKKLKLKGLKKVETFDQMRTEVLEACKSFKPDWAVFSAAVLDFAPQKVESRKVKSLGSWKVNLTPTPKILDEVKKKFPHIRRVGFKLETRKSSSPDRFAMDYLKSKKLEALCFNYLEEAKLKRRRIRFYASTGDKALWKGKGKIAKKLATFLGNQV